MRDPGLAKWRRRATKEIPVSCNKDCGGGCALIARVEGGRITRVFDNPRRPRDMRGCVRGYRAHEAVYGPERITEPLIRNGPRSSGRFRRAGWEEALDLVAERIERICRTFGSHAVLGFAGSGSCRGAVHNTAILTHRFLSCLGPDGYTGTKGSYSSAAQSFVLPYLFGRPDVGIDPLTLLRSRLILLWGANIVDTRFGADLETVVGRARSRGVPVIAVDPRRSRTVERLADEWIPIRPGADAALMSAMLHTMVNEDLVDRDYLERHTTGFEMLESQLLGARDTGAATPEWAASITGVSAESIRSLARRYASTKPTALITGLSIQRTVGGEEAVRLAVALQAATGNIGVPGGSPGCNVWGRLPGPRFGRIPANPVGNTAAGRSVPVYRWPDAILGNESPTSPPIRAVYAVGANYLCTGSDITKNRRAFDALDFSVCHDYFLTPTARRCDVVLPATTFLERDDVVFPAGNYLFYSARAVDPPGAARDDYDIFAELAGRLGFHDRFTEGRSSSDWLDFLLKDSEVGDIEEFIACGVYDGGDHERIGLSSFFADPTGSPLPTPSGKIELASARYASAGGPEAPVYRGVLPDRAYPLMLVSPHARYRINSQNATVEWAVRREPQRLVIHPDDAAARRVRHGALVVVESEIGAVSVEAEVTDGIMPGVVCLPAGMWPAAEPDGDDARADRSGAPNYLTSTEPTMPSRGARTHTVFVDVRPAE